MPTIDEKILNLLKQAPERLMSFRQLLRELDLDDSERHEIRQLLHGMVKSGNLIKLKGNRYTLPQGRTVVAGKLSAHRDGYGFVIPDKAPRDFSGDVFIPARFMGDAMQGDSVLVSVDKIKDGSRAEGRILKILERRNVTIVGQFKRGAYENLVLPYDSKIQQEILIRDGDEMDAAPDAIVNVEVTQFPHGARRLRGRVIEVLGFRGDFGIDVEIMIRKHQIPVEFSPAALRQAESCEEQVQPEEIAGRMDFRSLPIVTIDGETAKDFDDAVHVEILDNGNYLLGVHIADVAHYVSRESPLDREALRRGTSVYFPDRAVPMLPERLSNGICSLKPQAGRLTLSALMEIDRTGEVLRYSFHKGVIRSQERMTYTSVGKILVDRDPDQCARYQSLVPHFERMKELALVLNARRRSRGSIDFDLPEPVIHFDESGSMVSIGKSVRNIAHRIIEEFMLTANETVARHLFQRRVPSLYRIHEPPDPIKVFQFNEIALSFGYTLGHGFSETSLPELPPLKERSRRSRRSRPSPQSRDSALLALNVRVSPMDYQKLVDRITGKPEERILSYLMLRSLKQACYSPQNKGHFGLASTCYTHFTSPIRRYPDLMVHRILQAELEHSLAGTSHAPASQKLQFAFEKASPERPMPQHDKQMRKALRKALAMEDAHPEPTQPALYSMESLEPIAAHSSETERRADDAERELIDLKKLEFMADKLGEEYDGIVIHITKEGMLVELLDLFVEGFVRITTLENDDYQFRERPVGLVGRVSRNVFRLGDRLRVCVDRIDRFRKRVDLSVVDSDGSNGAAPTKT
jgi:ribonuclease R